MRRNYPPYVEWAIGAPAALMLIALGISWIAHVATKPTQIWPLIIWLNQLGEVIGLVAIWVAILFTIYKAVTSAAMWLVIRSYRRGPTTRVNRTAPSRNTRSSPPTTVTQTKSLSVRVIILILVAGWLLGVVSSGVIQSGVISGWFHSGIIGDYYEYQTIIAGNEVNRRVTDEGWEVAPEQPALQPSGAVYLRRPAIRIVPRARPSPTETGGPLP